MKNPTRKKVMLVCLGEISKTKTPSFWVKTGV